MNNYISEAKSFFSEAINKANKELLDAAISGNTETVKELSDVIYKFGQMEKVLGEDFVQPQNESKTKEPVLSNVTSKTITKTTPKATKQKVEPNVDEKILNQENSEIVPITADMTNKRPFAVTIFDETHLANSFRAVAETVCRKLYEKDQSAFLNLENNPSVNGDKHKYFSRKQEPSMTDAAIIGSGYKSIYIDVAKLAINNLFFLKRVINAMNVDPNTIFVTLDPNFQRKAREKRAM